PAAMRLDIEQLDVYFAEHRVAIAFLPTQFGEQFLRVATRHPLRAAFLGGEKLRNRPTERCEIINGYGPTEYTIAEIPLTANGKVDKRRLPEVALDVAAVVE